MLGSNSHSLRRPLAALLVVALLVAMAAAVGQPAPASAGDQASGPVRLGPSTGSYYNPVAPALQRTGDQEALGRLDRRTGTATVAPSAKVLAQAEAFDRKHAGGNPSAANVLGNLEARAAKTGRSPRAFKKAPSTQTARLLTVLVEFDPNANDDFSGSSARPPSAPRSASPSSRGRC